MQYKKIMLNEVFRGLVLGPKREIKHHFNLSLRLKG